MAKIQDGVKPDIFKCATITDRDERATVVSIDGVGA